MLSLISRKLWFLEDWFSEKSDFPRILKIPDSRRYFWSFSHGPTSRLLLPTPIKIGRGCGGGFFLKPAIFFNSETKLWRPSLIWICWIRFILRYEPPSGATNRPVEDSVRVSSATRSWPSKEKSLFLWRKPRQEEKIAEKYLFWDS